MNKNCYLENIIVWLIFWLLLFNIFVVILLYSDIKIKLELSISDFVNVFIAIIVSTIIPLSIWKIIEKKKSSKELLLFEINTFLNDLENLIKYIDNSDLDLPKSEKIDNITDVYIKILWNQYEIILDNCKKYFEKTNLDNFSEKYLDFRWAITDDIRKNDFEFSSFYMNQSLKHKLKLQKEIEKLKFEII